MISGRPPAATSNVTHDTLHDRAGSEDPLSALIATEQSHAFVIAQLGQSLDGRIATISGDSRDISGAAALDHLHRLRAHVDAVVVGVGTAIADDPQLTVRRVPGRSPARVVIDPSGRLPAGARCLAADGARRLVVGARPACADDDVETIEIPRRDGRLAPAAIIEALRRRGLKRILIEGGPCTIARFLAAGCLDRLHVLVSPLIIGSGRAGLDLEPITALHQALRPATRVHLLGGGDVLFDCDLRQPQG